MNEERAKRLVKAIQELLKEWRTKQYSLTYKHTSVLYREGELHPDGKIYKQCADGLENAGVYAPAAGLVEDCLLAKLHVHRSLLIKRG